MHETSEINFKETVMPSEESCRLFDMVTQLKESWKMLSAQEDVDSVTRHEMTNLFESLQRIGMQSISHEVLEYVLAQVKSISSDYHKEALTTEQTYVLKKDIIGLNEYIY